jgi:uncharacterized protein YeaO (DUF488 family)
VAVPAERGGTSPLQRLSALPERTGNDAEWLTRAVRITAHDGVVVTVRRVYDPPEWSDGQRILVDRLWPRGLRRDAAHLDEWVRAVAPSMELRRWYGHREARFAEFAERYRAELADADHAPAVAHLRTLVARGPVTLLTATRDLALAHTAVLVEILTAA